MTMWVSDMPPSIFTTVDWYIEPLKLSHEVMIQGVPIRQATPLRNGDKLTFGGVRGITLIFIDERRALLAKA